MTYREVALLLNITVDAARLKAKREALAGRWRLIRGDHPCDPVHVEVPAAEVAKFKSQFVASQKQKGRTPPPAESNPWVLLLQAAQARIGELTDQLIAEKDRHGETMMRLAVAAAKAK